MVEKETLLSFLIPLFLLSMTTEAHALTIQWLGHAAFLITTSDGTRILTDPYEAGAFGGAIGYKRITARADVVTVSHEHRDHNATQGLEGSPQIVRGTGVKTIKGITFKGIASFHDKSQGRERGNNTIFSFTVDGIRIAHFGDLGHVLTPSQIDEIGQVNVLLIPVGGFFTIDADEASMVVAQLRPAIVIPMHFKTEAVNLPIASVEGFLKGKERVRRLDTSEIELSKDRLPSATEIVVLKPSQL